MVLALHKEAAAGRQSEAATALGYALTLAREGQPLVESAIKEAQTAQAFKRTQSTLARFFPGRAQPHSDAANDKHTPAPSEPEPSIA